MPLASWPSTSDAMRYEPGVVGVNVKVAELPGSRSGVVHDGSIACVAFSSLTTEHELATVPRFSHCTVTFQATGTVSTSDPLP